ncbi:hypothetical protein [Acetobacter pomorum]|uniref:hypothetical protein n=1 Tax=Acetobacter pomorum TaxID=65959 RepID=UPI001ABF18D1|nr:hypothetical protein [Acetobacter pomorum]
MLELLMTAFRGDKIPAVCLDLLDYLSAVHVYDHTHNDTQKTMQGMCISVYFQASPAMRSAGRGRGKSAANAWHLNRASGTREKFFVPAF